MKVIKSYLFLYKFYLILHNKFMSIYELFIFYIFYSFLGWVWEELICAFTNKKLLKRGFGFGPLCFVYGSGAVGVLILLDGIKNEVNTFVLFLMCGVITCGIEYITSFYMEKFYNKRWWDYSYMKYHINGRVCLIGFIIFGMFSVIILKYINPYLLMWIRLLFTKRALRWISVSMFVLYVVDMIRGVVLVSYWRVFD